MKRRRRHLRAGLELAVLACALCALFPGMFARAVQTRTGERLRYASPIETLYSADGSRLFVLCQGTDEVRVLDAHTYAFIRAIPVGHLPRGFSLGGGRIFVANSWDDTISVIDARSLAVTATWHAPAEPSGLYLDPTGQRLFVAGRISNDVAVLDAATGGEEKRLAAGRGASYITPSNDGRLLFVTHVYPNSTRRDTQLGNRVPPESEITIINAVRASVTGRIPLPGIAHAFHTAVSSDGRLGVAAGLYPKNLVPLAHLEHAGAFADALILFGADVGAPVLLPLDELERYAARPFGVAITRDKRRIFVTASGSEAVLMLDCERMLRYVRAHAGSHMQDLSASASYVVKRIAVGHDPRGATLSPDGRSLVVANRLDDTLSVIDTATGRVSRTVRLASPAEISVLRHGEQTFYSADYSFQGQIGCANCHIDSTFDGLTWDLEPDGFGRDIVDNRPIEDLVGTEPYKWNGGNPDLPTECGPRTEKYFWRSENYDNLTLTDLVSYIRNLPPRPNRWRDAGGVLTPEQERGKAVFSRAVDKFGTPIPLSNRCSYCHSGPKGTSQRSFDVGTRKQTDDTGLLDTPQLTNIALSAPYLHDGSAHTLEEIWTLFNPADKHGRTSDLTKDELNDLVEYLRTR